MPGALLFFQITIGLKIFELIGTTSAFQPNCTLPPDHTSFVSGPNTRGTLTILWNSISILILCTWNIQHLNIPARRPYLDDTVSRGWLKKIWWAILDARRRLKWMVLTILIPEFVLGKAVNQWLAVRSGHKDLVHLSQDGGQKLQMIHAYFANMGGYYLDFTTVLRNTAEQGHQPHTNSIDEAEHSKEHQVSKTGTDNEPKTIGSFIDRVFRRGITKTDKINLSRFGGSRWTLNLAELYYVGSLDGGTGSSLPTLPYKRTSLFETLPYVDPQDLEKASRGDSLVKLIAILQVTWLMVQLLVRKIRNLPSSQLELAVFAFSVSSCITYLFLWNQPQGIDSRYAVQATRVPSEDEFGGIISQGPRYLWTWHRPQYRLDSRLGLAPLPNDASHQVEKYSSGNNLSRWTLEIKREILALPIGSILGGTILGGLHCLAWNFQFPAPTETLLWRISSGLMTGLPILSIPPNVLWARYNIDYDVSNRRRRMSWGLVLLIVFLIPYLLARVFIFFEMVRSLFYLPPEVFVNTLSNLP